MYDSSMGSTVGRGRRGEDGRSVVNMPTCGSAVKQRPAVKHRRAGLRTEGCASPEPVADLILMLIAITTFVALCGAGPTPVPTDTTEAFLDDAARHLVESARARRASENHAIERYRVVATERISAGIRALRRDRTLFRMETAARIDWRAEGDVRIDVLGSRVALPAVRRGVRVQDGVAEYVPTLAFEPRDEGFFDSMFSEQRLRHPLNAGAEDDYRYRSGETTTLRPGDGAEVRVRELVVLPRRDDSRLMRGSLWIDDLTHGVVRAVFTTASPLTVRGTGSAERGGRSLGLAGYIGGEIRVITVEYQLWDRRWWLPRLIALDGAGTVGRFANLPVRFERWYRDYRVEGPDPTTVALDRLIPEDTTPRRRGGPFSGCQGDEVWCRDYDVTLPDDTASLLSSDFLPATIWEESGELIDGSELRRLVDDIRDLPPIPWRRPRLSTHAPWQRTDLVRFNRVEGLSLGAGGTVDAGRLQADATVRLGLADLEPNGELGVERAGVRSVPRLAGYRRLVATDAAARPLGPGNSLSALLLGRDEGDYYRAWGAEITGRPAPAARGRWSWRAFTEIQRPATVHTSWSVPELIGGDADIRPNIVAEPATQTGVSASLGLARGMNPTGLRWSGEVGAEAAAGTFTYLRPAARLTLGAPLPGGWVAALEAAGGTAVGTMPVQRAWSLGGFATVRGHPAGSRRGDTYLRTRAEVGTRLPAARLVLFGDAGWAGARDRVLAEDPLLSAGIGAGLLDGLLRLDVARALQPDGGWRLHLSVDGLM